MNDEKEYYGYLYMITNKVNGKMYIGIRASSVFDENYWGSGKQIIAAVKKYGKENFHREVLGWYMTPEELVLAEVNELVSRGVKYDDRYYNMMDTKTPILFGEDNGFYGKTHTEKTKKHLSEIRTGTKVSEKTRKAIQDYWESDEGVARKIELSKIKKGKPISDEHRNNIKKYFTDEVRQAISEKMIKFYESEEGIKVRQRISEKASKRFKGVPKSEEHKKNISKALKGKKKDYMDSVNKNPEKIEKTAKWHRGKKRSDEARKNISEACKGRVPVNKGKIYIHDIVSGKIKLHSKDENIPDGYARGYGPRNKEK